MIRAPIHQLLPLLIIAILLGGCATPTTTPPVVPVTPVPTPLPTATPSSSVAPARPAFAPYEPVQVSVRPVVAAYQVAPNLTNVANVQVLASLSPQQREVLARNGFVVVPSQEGQFYEIYKRAKERNIPIFVTTDALLHTYHILYDYVLRTAEIEHFVSDLQSLDKALLETTLSQYAQATGATKEAAKRNAAYFAVALRLLDPAFAVPAEVKSLVDAELALIQKHAGFAESPIFGYREDYSQYVPRGHYTRNETFQRYFRAMMWHGRIMFRLAPGFKPEQIAKGRAETRQALLIVQALRNTSVAGKPALTVWESIYAPTAFFVGKADDLSVTDYAPLSDTVFGPGWQLSVLNDDAKVDAFIQAAKALPAPRIVSSYVTDMEKPEEVTKGFRFMGQRFIPDSYIFQQLVYDKVGTRTKPRLFPKGLDVAAALGSARALEILDKTYGEFQYANYEKQMEKLRREFADLTLTDWTQNLYWGWLHVLRALFNPPDRQGYPTFMRSQAWTDKQLNTALGSWTQLRHDTILYAKQSYSLRVTGIAKPPQLTKGYVEPEPEVYARLAALAKQTRTGLLQRGLLNDEYKAKLQGIETLLLTLKTISEKELANQPLTDEEYNTIWNIGQTLEAISTFTEETGGKITSEADSRVALVADVHTDPNSNQVLEEGVGDVFHIYAIVPMPDGTLWAAIGGVYSYYEFLWPMADRLTDEKWQALSPKPALPVWAASFLSTR